MPQFEWDEAKARLNVAKHGVTFDKAKAVFSDPFAFIRYDDRLEPVWKLRVD
jgi:uncharacterized protein